MFLALSILETEESPSKMIDKKNLQNTQNKGRFSLDSNQIKYLEDLARDTWICLDFLWEPSTGLPYDNIYKGEYTSVTNIGLGFAVTAGAYMMGYLDRSEAVQRLRHSVQSLNQMKRWHGFCQSWNSVKTLQPSKNDYWISTLDTGNMVGGMLIAKSIFPEIEGEIQQYLDQMDWSWLYDRENHQVYGGYITNEEKYAGPLTLLGGDPRFACFLAIAYGAANLDSWKKLDRNFEEKYGQKYLVPGWQGGGLFMQYISGLFMDEWASPLNRSAANFAYAQILHAQENQYPVWGWSASDSPKDGYLGWGHLKDEVVTPHASVLVIAHYPKQVLKNLKQLEEMGARAPYVLKGKSKHFGFRDAMDIKTKEVANNYLYLDQGMIFLTLVNYLRDNILRKAVESQPEISKTKSLLSDYRSKDSEQFSSVLKMRDERPGEDSIESLTLFDG
jgi:hypothetical protein